MHTLRPCKRAAVLQHDTIPAGQQSPNAWQINAIGSCNRRCSATYVAPPTRITGRPPASVGARCVTLSTMTYSGRKGGRTPRRAEEPRVHMAYTMSVNQHLSVTEICQTLQISPALQRGRERPWRCRQRDSMVPFRAIRASKISPFHRKSPYYKRL